MPWTWRYEKTDGAVVACAGQQETIFASQGDARAGWARTGTSSLTAAWIRSRS